VRKGEAKTQHSSIGIYDLPVFVRGTIREGRSIRVTIRQKQVLEFITNYIGVNGFAPSYEGDRVRPWDEFHVKRFQARL
jgi:hypothetical protein